MTVSLSLVTGRCFDPHHFEIQTIWNNKIGSSGTQELRLIARPSLRSTFFLLRAHEFVLPEPAKPCLLQTQAPLWLDTRAAARPETQAMSRWVLVTPGQCPPENTPLISSVDELAQDKARIDEWKDKAGESFPGRDASFDEKLKWYHSFNDSAWDDFMAGAPEPPEYVPAVLLDACDDSVELQLIIKRGEASLLNKIDDESKAKFMASAERARGEPLRQRVLNKARSTEKGLAAYVEWLADGENGAPGCEMRSKTTPKPVPLLHSGVGREPFDDVVVAARTVAKGDCADSAIRRLMRDAGLYGSVMAPAITSDWSIVVHNAGDGVDKVVKTCSTSTSGASAASRWSCKSPRARVNRRSRTR